MNTNFYIGLMSKLIHLFMDCENNQLSVFRAQNNVMISAVQTAELT